MYTRIAQLSIYMLNSKNQCLIIEVGIYKQGHKRGKIDPCHNEVQIYQHNTDMCKY